MSSPRDGRGLELPGAGLELAWSGRAGRAGRAPYIWLDVSERKKTDGDKVLSGAPLLCSAPPRQARPPASPASGAARCHAADLPALRCPASLRLSLLKYYLAFSDSSLPDRFPNSSSHRYSCWVTLPAWPGPARPLAHSSADSRTP